MAVMTKEQKLNRNNFAFPLKYFHNVLRILFCLMLLNTVKTIP